MELNPTWSRWAARSIKRVAIGARLYRPVRWAKRTLDRSARRAYRDAIDLYRQMVPLDALCFDVGANIGAVSEVLLECGARVVAFEPNPTVIPELRARCSGKAKWTLVPSAVGAASDMAILYERASHGQSSLHESWEGKISKLHSVQVVTLDSAIQRFGTPYYCKIDVEGYELEVLRGLSTRIPLISFEFHTNDENISRARSSLEILRLNGSCSVNFTPAESFRFGLENWIAVDDFIKDPRHYFDLGAAGTPYGDIWVRTT